MEKVHIQYFGTIRAAAQKSEDRIAGDTTVLQLLQKLAGDYGDGFREEVLAGDGDKIRDDITVTINGTIISHEVVDGVHLRPGDSLALLPLFPGGG